MQVKAVFTVGGFGLIIVRSCLVPALLCLIWIFIKPMLSSSDILAKRTVAGVEVKLMLRIKLKGQSSKLASTFEL
jgi:hypothetical protein